MGAKKKKGARRISQSEFEAGDALLQEIMTASSRRGQAPTGGATLPPSLLALEPAKKETPSEKREQEKEKEEKEKGTDSPASTAEVAAIAPESDLKSEATTALSTDAEDMEPVVPSLTKSGDGKCQHVKNAVKLPKVRKGLAHQKDWDHCQGCIGAEARVKKLAQRMGGLSLTAESGKTTEAEGERVEAQPAELLWMCLSCCEINCGRTIKKHALTHHDEKKNSHPLAINLGTMDCWCYDCDDQIVPSKNRNQVIQECQVAIEKALQIKQSKMRAASAVTSKKTKGSVAPITVNGAGNTVVSAIQKAKVFTPGLQNLGNTCFFNSVVQILTETKSLKAILSDSEHQDPFAFSKSLAAITDAGLGPLTTSFKEFLDLMWKQQGGTIAPKQLFSNIANKWKVFRGFRQQDSQELMRYLFDGIKQEEIDMIKRQLAEETEEKTSSNIERPSDGHSEEAVNDVKKNTDEGAGRTFKYVPFIDSCFSGKLVSVIVCDACKKCSYAPEDFFDLSLPVRKATQASPSTGGSSLKARLVPQSRVSSPAAADPTVSDPSPTSMFSPATWSLAGHKDPLSEADKPSEAHLRHVEKVLRNIGQSSSETLSIQRSLNQFTGVDCLDGENKFACDNCYKLIKATKDRELGEGGISEMKPESEVTKDATDGKGVQAEEQSEAEPTPESINLDDEAQKEEVRPTEEKEQASDSDTESMMKDESSEEEKEQEIDRFGNTVLKVARPSRAEGKKLTEKPEELPKHVFRKAYKRYLISQLPPTLVLHLKRFEQTGRIGMTRKIEDHVEIPVELDMSPYFVPKDEIENEGEEAFEENQQQHQDDGMSKRYRLYGAVVHMGSLGGGHYINYVLSSKVSVPDVTKAIVEEKETQINAKGVTAALADTQKETAAAQDSKGEDGQKDAVDTRQWISCSDSSVRLASLEEVLGSRAYLLFYERC